MKLNLKKIGVYDSVLPKSLATCLDFVAIWGSSPNRAQLGRLCAAAISLCVDHEKCLPAYPVLAGDPIGYGHKILDRLLDAGVKPAYIYEVGSNLLVEMMKEIPTEEAIEEKVNFT
tara:strand:+ start:1111 stop:1458 length:348 start_codon:yes stop_codon:yes gene_type:complete